MNQCKQCGASVPEDAKFCLQCGAEIQEPAPAPRNAPPQQELAFVQPAVTGGLALGVLSALPIIGAANCLCCLWVQGGGALATWLLNKQRPLGLRYGDGALVGVLSGVVGGVVSTLIGIPMQMLMFNEENFARMQEVMNQNAAGMPPELRDLMLQFMTPGFNPSMTLIILLLNVVLYSLFAMVGGIITVAILNRKSTD